MSQVKKAKKRKVNVESEGIASVSYTHLGRL